MNQTATQEERRAFDRDLDEKYLAAVQIIRSAPALECLGKHRFASDLLVEARSAVEPDATRIAEISATAKEFRAAVISWAEADRAVDRLSAIHEEIKAERAIP